MRKQPQERPKPAHEKISEEYEEKRKKAVEQYLPGHYKVTGMVDHQQQQYENDEFEDDYEIEMGGGNYTD